MEQNTQKTEQFNFSSVKHYFIGIALGSASTTETGAAVIDSDLNIITLDKLFTMEDVRYFIDHFIGKQNAILNIAMPENPTMLNAKWKLHSRQYQLVQSNRLINKNSDWIKRYSHRGCDYFKELKESGLDIFRFDIRELKTSMGLAGLYRDRTPVDCKAFQSALKYKFGIRELPSNMLPVAQLEAILGAYLGYTMAVNTQWNPLIKSNYNNIDVAGMDAAI